MHLLARRELLIAVGALAAEGCHAPPRRETVLRALANDLLPADAAHLALQSEGLRQAAEHFSLSPGEPELSLLRAAFRRAAIAWKQASAFRWGPLVESGALARAGYWPVRGAAVRAVLEEGRGLTGKFIADLGADVKGLYAIEYALFDRDEVAAGRLLRDDAAGHRARELVRLYAEDVNAQASNAKRELVNGAPRFAERLARRPDEAVARTAAMFLENIEGALVSRFRVALWLASLGKLRVVDVEGGPSGISHELALTLLAATQRLYRGALGSGFAALVRRAAPRVHDHVDALFARGFARLRTLPPIDEAARVVPAALEQANFALKELEVAFRDEVPNALGVTLTFGGLDAD